MGRLLFDSALCTGCRACELACSWVKTGSFWPDRSRVRVVRLEWEGLDLPLGCEQCEPAPCIAACPTRALRVDPATEGVLLDPADCIGCKQCVVVCPFLAIHFDPASRQLYKCDVCEGDPECVRWCETEALRWQTGEEAESGPAKAGGAPATAQEAVA